MIKYQKGLESFIPFWKYLKDDEIKFLLENSYWLKVAAEQTFYHGNDECLGILFIKSGRLRAYMISDDGRELTLYFMGKGEGSILAASCILKNNCLPVSISGEMDSEVLVISPLTYRMLCEHNREVETCINGILSRSFSLALEAIQRSAFLTIRQRLIMLLLQQKAFERSTKIHLTQAQISRHLGTARECVSRQLKQLIDEGLIRTFRGGAELLDLEALEQQAKIPN